MKADRSAGMKNRVIGLGNTLLSDDGAGIYAAREVAARLPANAGIEVIETEVGGFALMELLSGAHRAILVDSIQFDGLQPGTVMRIDPDDLHTSLRLRSVHEIDLPTVLGLGRRLGLDMPEDLLVIGIQAKDALTLGETLTPAVERGVARAAALILEELAAVPAATKRANFLVSETLF